MARKSWTDWHPVDDRWNSDSLGTRWQISLVGGGGGAVRSVLCGTNRYIPSFLFQQAFGDVLYWIWNALWTTMNFIRKVSVIKRTQLPPTLLARIGPAIAAALSRVALAFLLDSWRPRSSGHLPALPLASLCIMRYFGLFIFHCDPVLVANLIDKHRAYNTNVRRAFRTWATWPGTVPGFLARLASVQSVAVTILQSAWPTYSR